MVNNFNFDNSKKLIPFAKYLYEYSFLAFNENGNIFKVDHDWSNWKGITTD
jgi:hypothetical protein